MPSPFEQADTNYYPDASKITDRYSDPNGQRSEGSQMYDVDFGHKQAGKRAISGLIKPVKVISQSRQFPKKYNWDVKLNPKEYVRSMKNGTTNMMSSYESKSFQIRSVSNYALQKTKKMHND
jgi:hypothetical protein